MIALSIKTIAEATKGRIIRGSEDITVEGISTDTRTISPNDAFFALIGDTFNAHDMVCDLDASKCRLVVVSDENCIDDSFDCAAILVEDTLTAYQDLAGYYKKMINPITIGVTGSVGKTTLKDMLKHIASKKYKTVATEGNYNNEVGVPKTIFHLEEDTEVLILEMGMDHEGELRRLAEIAEPTIAAITNIGLAHRENFDTDEGIYNAKMEIVSFFGKGNYLVINADDRKLRHAPTDNLYTTITVGECSCRDYVVSDIKYVGDNNLSFYVSNNAESVNYTLPVAGSFNAVAAGMASAILSIIGIHLDFSAHALSDLERTPHRLQLIKLDGYKIIDDVYNASPDSMKSALEYLMKIPGGRKIAVLAGMNELGADSTNLHREIGAIAVNMGVDIVISVGEKARDIAEGAVRAEGNQRSNSPDSQSLSSAEKLRILSFRNNEDASSYISLHRKKDDVYLVKGSRTMKTEEIVRSLIGEMDD